MVLIPTVVVDDFCPYFAACSNGTYGENCQYNCSGHCFQNETCNRLEGYCPNGCDIGWDGEACEGG